MIKKNAKAIQPAGFDKTVKKILLGVAQPETSKNPYTELANKYGVAFDFAPFVTIEPVPAKEFKKQKIDLAKFSAVIFTSKNAITHFFRVMAELKLTPSANTKYFCTSNTVAVYLQKYITYRKRKVFFGADGKNESLFAVILKHKENENFLYPCSEMFDNQITNFLKENKVTYEVPILYTVIDNNISDILHRDYDVIGMFTPGSVRSVVQAIPKTTAKKPIYAAFGYNTLATAEDYKIDVDIFAPQPGVPSLVNALDLYLGKKTSKNASQSSAKKNALTVVPVLDKKIVVKPVLNKAKTKSIKKIKS